MACIVLRQPTMGMGVQTAHDRVAGASADEATTVRPQAREPLVLVADDNEGNRALVRSTLEPEGCRVILAKDGEEAVAAFERESPDCVVLDIRMPKLDGFGVCRRIRAHPRGPDTPILFFTALRDVDTFDQALEAGGDDFLTKPVRPAELLVRVQTALKLREMGVELRQYLDLVRRQRDDLIRTQLQRERLMAFVVHDLKNPVNAMDLHAQLLLRDKDLPEAVRESASLIRTEARHLTRMILNLLDLSKADEGKLTTRRESLDLRAIVDAIFVELEVVASRGSITLQATLDVDRVWADEDILRRTLVNLVENALRYTKPESVVEVRARRTDEGVEIRVADAGSGIPENMRDKVFEPFTQLGDTASYNRSERGLGLTFCKTAVEAHGGRIWIEDGAPGAVFCMVFPHEP